MSTKNGDTGILSFVRAAIHAVPSSPLLAPLLASFEAKKAAISDIEASFAAFTSRVHPAEATRTFVHGWSLTNHSAMCVSGISNRLTLEILAKKDGTDTDRLVQAVVELNRISDEDLGVGGGTLHADLFYEMAEALCRDDAWLSRRYALPEAAAFREYKHRSGLKHPDVVHGLLTTVVHEVYTHGEVELILPLFRGLLDRSFDMDERQKRRKLAWISVHCGRTEREHFFHAVSATDHYAAARGIDLRAYDLQAVFEEYIDTKAAAMRALAAHLHRAEAPAVALQAP